MKKQYAVFGLGKFGSSVAVTLEKLGCEVIAVDIAEEKSTRDRRSSILRNARGSA